MSQLVVLAALIAEQNGSDVTAEELQFLQELCWEQTQDRSRLTTTSDPGYVEPTADVGKSLGFIFGAVLGAFFLPGLGVAAGWFAGAVIGGTIGGKLASLFDGPGKSGSSTTTTDPLFRFSGVGSLATLNTAIPKIYGNRLNNPDGGVLLRDPPRIYTRAYSQLGARYLQTCSILSYGQLGEVNTQGFRADDKPIGDWEVSDITSLVSPGLPEQAAQTTYYSQAVSIGTNAFVGSSPIATVGNVSTNRDPAVLSNFTNVSPSTTAISKPNGGGRTNGWNAGATTQSLTSGVPAAPVFGFPISGGGGYGSYIVVEGFVWAIATTDLSVAIGFTASGIALDPANMLWGVEIYKNSSSTGWNLYQNGTVIASGSTTIPSVITKTKIELRIYRGEPQRYLEIWIGGAIAHRQLIALAYPYTLTGAVAIQLLDNTIESIRTGVCAEGSGDVSPAYGTHFMVKTDVLPKFKAAQLYSANGVSFTVVEKNPQYKYIRTSQPIDLYEGLKIQSFYRAAITTSKAVTAIELILQATIFARNDKGDYLTHAQAFRLAIKFPGDPTEYTIGRFIVASKTENPLIRSLTIGNLPKGIYQVLLTPISDFEINADIQSLEDNSLVSTIFVPGTTNITLTGEFGAVIDQATARSYATYTGKAQTSADRGPQIQVTHLNEIVNPPLPPTYPNYTISSLKLLASDRLQNAPAETHDIPQGAIVPNYLFASELSVNGSGNYTFVDRVAPGKIAPGDVIRILGRGSSVVTNVTGTNTVTCNEYIGGITTIAGHSIVTLTATDYAAIYRWSPISAAALPNDTYVIAKIGNNQIEVGGLYCEDRSALVSGTGTATFNANLSALNSDEIVIYRMASSNYFPDLYVDRLINAADGLGNYIDKDHFIDYPSIVRARDFCVRRKFFFDGVVGEGSFEQWAISTAPSSLLFCTEFNGRYALVTQEDGDPSPFLFNDSNVIKFTEAGVPWQLEATNVVLVKYQDNLGREKQVKIATAATIIAGVAMVAESEVVQTIECRGVTSLNQAIAVGQTSLKSLRLQNRTCQIVTDVASGLYTRQGEIVRSQHTSIEYGNERNGFVMSSQLPDNGRFQIYATIPIQGITNGYLVATQPHQIEKFGNAVANSDRIIITSNTLAANNGTFAASNLLWIDDRSIIISPSPSSGAGTGGTMQVERYVYDQIIKLSETIVVTGNTRITIAHKSRVTEQDRPIVDLGGGLYKVLGVEEAISFGDAFAIGEVGTFYRKWRITSLQPDTRSNTVTLTGVLWDASILNTDGLVVI